MKIILDGDVHSAQALLQIGGMVLRRPLKEVTVEPSFK
jgi:hypothetical protein